MIKLRIRVCRVWREKTGVQVFRRKLHSHIHLDYTRIEFYLSQKKKKNNNNNNNNFGGSGLYEFEIFIFVTYTF